MHVKFLLPLVLSATALFAQNSGPLAPLPADGFVPLSLIVSDFAAHPKDAFQKYNGARIIVYGRLASVTQGDDKNSNPVAAYLQLPNRSTPDVKCVFPADNLPRGEVQVSDDQTQVTIMRRNYAGDLGKGAPFLNAGENVAIHGTFHKFVAGDIVLKDCKKVLRKNLSSLLRQNGIAD